MRELKVLFYLEASTKDALVERMVKNNAANGTHFNYFQPTKDGKNWVVWFKADLNTYRSPEQMEVLNVRPSV